MRYWSVLLIVVLFFTSCKNDISDEIVDTSKAKTLAHYLFLDAFRTTLAEVPDFVVEGQDAASSVKVSTSSSFDISGYPKTITIDYGTTNQEDKMGISRRGRVKVLILSDKITKGDFKITFDEYYLNDSRMLGEITSKYTGSASGDNYSLTLNDTCKVANSNGTMSYNGDIALTMKSGKSTFDVYDDVYTIVENSKGQDFEGVSYSAKSAVDYLADFSCRWLISSGVSEVNPNDRELQTLTLGSGSCDGIVSAEYEKDKFISFQIK